MKYSLSILFGLLLAGCYASAKYDIDVSCEMNQYSPYIQGDDNETQIFSCGLAGKDFFIRCDKHTIQEVDGSLFCTTHDGKSVRIRII